MSVQVTFKTLSGGNFTLSVAATDTILDVKKKIADEQNVADHTGYRLIFQGKILDDAATVQSSGVSASPTNFVVVMPPRKKMATSKMSTPTKPTAKPPTTEEKETKVEKKEAPAEPATEPAAPKSDPPSTATTAAGAGAGTGTGADPNALVTGDEYEQSLRQICDMGFPEDQVKRALQAAYNNPDRAVEFLFNGIPETAPRTQTPTTTTPATPPATQQTTPSNPAETESGNNQQNTPFNMFESPQGASPGQTGTESNSLDFLRSMPQFNLMRRLIQTNPAVLPQILQRLESINPQLMAMVEANQEEFNRLVNEPVTENDESEAEVMNQLTQAIANAGGTGGTGEQNEVFVTAEEHEQINRLTELAADLGIQPTQVLETWLACNRDETLAANFLVDNVEDLIAHQRTNDETPQNRNNNEET